MTGIVEVHLDRPEAKNAISKEMLRGLRHAFESVDCDPSVNVLMIRSTVPKVFCAGADLKVFLFFQLVYIGEIWYNLQQFGSLSMAWSLNSSPFNAFFQVQERKNMTASEVQSFVTSLRSAFSFLEVDCYYIPTYLL